MTEEDPSDAPVQFKEEGGMQRAFIMYGAREVFIGNFRQEAVLDGRIRIIHAYDFMGDDFETGDFVDRIMERLIEKSLNEKFCYLLFVFDEKEFSRDKRLIPFLCKKFKYKQQKLSTSVNDRKTLMVVDLAKLK